MGGLRGWRLAPGTVAGGVTDGNRKEASEVVLGTGRDRQEGKELLSPVTGPVSRTPLGVGLSFRRPWSGGGLFCFGFVW